MTLWRQSWHRRGFSVLVLLLATSFEALGWAAEAPRWNGYIEAQYTYVSVPFSGRLHTLSVQAGDTVKQGEPLFLLDPTSQRLQVQQAQAQLAQTQAQLADIQQGARADEILAIQAQLKEAYALEKLTFAEKTRWSQLAETGKASQSQKEQAIEAWQVAKAKIDNLKATLHLAKLGARDQQVKAAQASVDIAMANLQQQEWRLSELQVVSPIDAQIDQAFHSKSEFVNAGTPVLSLITPDRLKVIFYVPQAHLSEFSLGQTVQVFWDGEQNQPLSAQIRFISQSAEFTPPVIFSQKSRQKLVYKLEAILQHSHLRPGQPVDIGILP